MFSTCHFTLLALVTVHLTKAENLDHYKLCDHLEPDVFMTPSELIRARGYPVQEHIVQTEDGYLLLLLRILPKNGQIGGRTPVLLQHGMASSAFDFVANFGNQSLGYFLTEDGYDVWLTNSRGNTYSKKHIHLKTEENQFWEFSFDEMALYDLPAFIDFVLNQTGHNKLFYMAHSAGNNQLFALLSEKPEYNDKIRLFVALNPAMPILPSHPSSLLMVRNLKKFLSSFGVYSYKGLDQSKLSDKLCTAAMTPVMISSSFGMPVVNTHQFNYTRLPVYYANIPNGFSFNTIYHMLQMNAARKLQRFDFSLIGNLNKYGEESPPEYLYQRTTCPVVILWGANDITTSPEHLKKLSDSLHNLVSMFHVNYFPWFHHDSLLAIDAYSLQNVHISTFLKSF